MRVMFLATDSDEYSFELCSYADHESLKYHLRKRHSTLNERAADVMRRRHCRLDADWKGRVPESRIAKLQFIEFGYPSSGQHSKLTCSSVA